MTKPITLTNLFKDNDWTTEGYGNSVLFHFQAEEPTCHGVYVRIKDDYVTKVELILKSIGYETQWNNDSVCIVRERIKDDGK